MKFEPMIKVFMKQYQESFGLKKLNESELFEHFVNYTILKSHQPNAFNVINDICNLICVDGQNDMGIDGIAIKVNDVFISSREDIESIVTTHKKIKFEFIFIQSKHKEKFDSGEYGKFVDGVTDFLQDVHYEPHNEQIDYWLKIKEYLMSDEVMNCWIDVPNIRIYYVAMGSWTENEHIIAKTERLKSDIKGMKAYGEVSERYIDSALLKSMCEENENNFSSILNIIDSFELTEVAGVENSLIIMCEAKEIINMLESSDKLLRKSIFTDNVRDFQGDTMINNEILQTIKESPQNFILMNNGITIVCNKALSINRKVTLSNPQVVNGCQTCNVLYEAYKQGINLSEIVVTIKIISTLKNEITNQIVKGTNRQNIVYDEAFEITRVFHKNLEDFFLAMSEVNDKYYYERRSKQYSDNVTILATQKANFRILIQSFISLFLQMPYQGSMHQARLLQNFQNRIFVENQSLFPYYVAPCLLLALDNIFRNKMEDRRWCITYRYQLLYLVGYRIAGFPPDINNSKKIDIFCEQFMIYINDKEKLERVLDEAIIIFRSIIKEWIKLKGSKYIHAVKDTEEFNSFMIKTLHTNEPENFVINSKAVYRGTVVKEAIDKNGCYYGFISKSVNNIFFHSHQSANNIPFGKLFAHDVLYTISKDKNGNEFAIITKLVER